MDEQIHQRILTAERWSRRFQESVAGMKAVSPPGDIDPLLWQAQIDACQSMSDELAEQAQKLKRGALD